MFRLQYFKEKEENMTRKNYFNGKRSEYRHNYLPFDFYDFWITAKENQNQRYKNKIRDYLHTPFDWDEDQDFYTHSASSFGAASSSYDSLAHQSTQTTYRSGSEYNGSNRQISKENHHNQTRPKSSISFQDEKVNEKINKKKRTIRNQTKMEHKNLDEENKKNPKHEKEQVVKIQNKKKQPEETVKIEKQIVQGKKRLRKYNKSKSIKNEFQANYLNNAANSRNISNFDKVLARSISSMTVHTPEAWNLRDYKPKPSKTQSNTFLEINLII